MSHRIVILGGGYAGVTAANRIARRLDGAEVTLVNERATFVERVRLHQVAAGESLASRPLRELVRPGVDVVVGRAGRIDLERRQVVLDGGAESEPAPLPYDTLVYALGSVAAPGPDDAVALATADDAWWARDRVAELVAEHGTVAVVGGGLTGIEAATELAERHPAVRVRLVSDVEPGPWLSHRAQGHLRRVFHGLGIEVAGGSVADVRDGSVRLTDGRVVGAGLTLACTGFAVPAVARDSGLAVDEVGRIRVDRTLRSVSHPDVYAVGDAAVPQLPNGRPFRMACATALPMSAAAGAAIADRLAGRRPTGLRFRYVNQCVSLGRRNGVIQAVAADDHPHRIVLTGAVAARYKETVVRGATWFTAHPGPNRPVPRTRV
ncbi:NAD(P)/FAD-dependent oxidoreductase [Prauserella alba]|uniref:FAD-dependent oxidoreductase n=1 Tax=Prauserella alba TaxID=176898 RepID=A0ABN1VPT8_9PSEU|nr:FAD-dependent oxidoreductase [Prauserella alba]MCP2180730.1 NADH dehydrogenase, FAD-containing subunit [Prauserella alba]